ncbi:unnamed protein product [Lampetra fluviatilis]
MMMMAVAATAAVVAAVVVDATAPLKPRSSLGLHAGRVTPSAFVDRRTQRMNSRRSHRQEGTAKAPCPTSVPRAHGELFHAGARDASVLVRHDTAHVHQPLDDVMRRRNGVMDATRVEQTGGRGPRRSIGSECSTWTYTERREEERVD